MRKILLNACSKDGSYSLRNGIYLRNGFSIPDPAVLLSDGPILKNSRSVVSGLDSKGLYFIKQYKKNGLWRTLKRILQFPRAYRCLAAAIRLEETGIETPKVLLASRFYLVTEALSFQTVFLTNAPEDTFDFIPAMARMHQAGLSHGDLNLRNIYRHSDKFGLIDLDSARIFVRGLPERERIRELARLISSYLKQTGLRTENARAVIEKSAELYQKETGFNPYGSFLIARVKYLAERRKS